MTYYLGGHVCGLYYLVPGRWNSPERVYLPQVGLKAHASIVSTTSRTVLTQTFANPSGTEALKEVRYTFPLYDGVSVVGFKCQIGSRVIVGEVKEKEKAKAVFKEAVEKGDTAGLMEQLPDASDVFTTTVGNIPSGANVFVTITYLGELKNDMEVDGIRFTIPTTVCPRYGRHPQGLQDNNTPNATGTDISITVDVEVAEGSFIQLILSPSHPIAVSMGTSSIAPTAAPSLNKASATLTLGKAELTTDFVLKIIAKDTGVPKAILETHPTLPNQRALMATLVPKFSLPPEKPEIVFVCDRSGSMDGTRIILAIQALKVFLKSLPVGAKFNICSFGSSHSFFWPKSVTYSQETLNEAMQHVEHFQANYHGTEMLAPLRDVVERRYQDIPLEVMLLTDGEVWNQQELFSYLNEKIAGEKAPIRVFTLGVGTGVSHALIEGIARAGDGFSQSVGEGEPMGSKVVRMLKGALSPHINDYTLEVRYAQSEESQVVDDDDDFELIEKVTDSLQVKLDLKETQSASEPTKPISLYDESANPDQEPGHSEDKTGEARYAHLPEIPVPKILQAPQKIPSLFAFNRTTVYLLLGPEAPQKTPKTVILRGTSKHGPLELEIPVQALDQPGQTIHQLAAKKAIAELEQGRGWLAEARDPAAGKLLKVQYESRFPDMAEREAVRLGVQFQVGGKWCSFVAVEKHDDEEKEREESADPKKRRADDDFDEMEEDLDLVGYSPSSGAPQQSTFGPGARRRKRASEPGGPMAAPSAASMQQRAPPGAFGYSSASVFGGPQTSAFGASSTAAFGAPPTSAFGGPSTSPFVGLSTPAFGGRTLPGSARFTSFSPQPPTNQPQAQMTAPQAAPVSIRAMTNSVNMRAMAAPFNLNSRATSRSTLMNYKSLDTDDYEERNADSHPRRHMARNHFIDVSVEVAESEEEEESSEDEGDDRSTGANRFLRDVSNSDDKPSVDCDTIDMGFDDSGDDQGYALFESDDDMLAAEPASAVAPSEPMSPDAILDTLIEQQTFEGYWQLVPALAKSVGLGELDIAKKKLKDAGLEALDERVAATCLAIAFLETRMAEKQDVWELLWEKARAWLEERVQEETKVALTVDAILRRVAAVF